MLDVEKIRKDFPILDQIVNDEPLSFDKLPAKEGCWNGVP